MSIVVIGVNHRTSPVELLERVTIPDESMPKALHSLITGLIKPRYAEFITVMERMDSKRIHYHLLVVMGEDIRTGFDGEQSCKRR